MQSIKIKRDNSSESIRYLFSAEYSRWNQFPEDLVKDLALPNMAVEVYGVLALTMGETTDVEIASKVEGADPHHIPNLMYRLWENGWIAYTDDGVVMPLIKRDNAGWPIRIGG